MHYAETFSTRPAAEPQADQPLLLDLLRQTISDRYGFWINEAWLGQVSVQVAARTVATGKPHPTAYLRWVCSPEGEAEEMPVLLESLLNGETHFFRTEPHFAALLSAVVPPWRAAGSESRRLRIASLGCATGEEPYSIALALREYLSPAEFAELEVTGVDLCRRFLETARAGTYESRQLRELSPILRKRWFRPAGDCWQVHPDLQHCVRFLHHNLLQPLPFAGLDALFCRNVLIYFRRETIAACFKEFHAALRPGGYLFLGHSESAFGFPDLFEPVQVPDGIIYQKKSSLTEPS